MTIATLTKAILADYERPAPPRQEALKCFTCARTYIQGDGRFCSRRCRDAFDAGLPPAEFNAGLRQELMPYLYGHQGCRVVAGPPGVKVGSLYYAELIERRERRLRRDKSSDPIRPKRKCECCGSDIPRYRGIGKARRLVREDAKFCSEKCRKIGGF